MESESNVGKVEWVQIPVPVGEPLNFVDPSLDALPIHYGNAFGLWIDETDVMLTVAVTTDVLGREEQKSAVPKVRIAMSRKSLHVLLQLASMVIEQADKNRDSSQK